MDGHVKTAAEHGTALHCPIAQRLAGRVDEANSQRYVPQHTSKSP
jgi:hypothetical protein